ncbi:universal stress protein [Janthinobacterium fluminis]|uniref:Universal stress protein n=1 Tax=Janthinobacterium fluminis TaxID=2987524 RepID=A0ABT5JX74_9BURK|nr:universal stress protein [Janthinobacterium fluminis]MDC8756763.1 universal stress protein [Janthinobacterium fluminis]
MAYKTILVHADQSKHAPERIRVAAALAVAEGAHLVGAALSGISGAIYQADAVDLTGAILAGRINTEMDHARTALAQFESLAKAAGVNTYESRLLNDDPQGGLSLQARYSDLVVLSQCDLDEGRTRIIPDLPEYVVLNSARPVLIVPYAGHFPSVGKRALVAWDGSMESTRALTNALPLLRRADNVALALFNPSKRQGVHGELPGADIALVLARHGVKVEVLPQHTDIDVGNALLSLASDQDSDLIVMGGYGHSRFREMLLGGVTKTVLQTMTVPVLMSH